MGGAKNSTPLVLKGLNLFRTRYTVNTVDESARLLGNIAHLFELLGACAKAKSKAQTKYVFILDHASGTTYLLGNMGRLFDLLGVYMKPKQRQ